MEKTNFECVDCVLHNVEAHESTLIIASIPAATMSVGKNGTTISFNLEAIIDLFTPRPGRSSETSAKLQLCVSQILVRMHERHIVAKREEFKQSKIGQTQEEIDKALYWFDDETSSISKPARSDAIKTLSSNLRGFVSALKDVVPLPAIWKFLQNEIVHCGTEISFLKAALHFLPEAESKEWLSNGILLNCIAQNLSADPFKLYQLCLELMEIHKLLSQLFQDKSLFTYTFMERMFRLVLKKETEKSEHICDDEDGHGIDWVEHYIVFLKMLCCYPDHETGKRVIVQLLPLMSREMKQPLEEVCVQMFEKLWIFFQQQNMVSVCAQILKIPMIAHVKMELFKCDTTWDVKFASMQSFWSSQCTTQASPQCTSTTECVYEIEKTLVSEITDFFLANIPEHREEMIVHFHQTAYNTVSQYWLRQFLRKIKSDTTRRHLMFREVFNNKFFVAIVLSLCRQYKWQKSQDCRNRARDESDEKSQDCRKRARDDSDESDESDESE